MIFREVYVLILVSALFVQCSFAQNPDHSTENTAHETQTFEINDADMEDVAEKVSAILTPEVGKLKLDKRTNKFTVTDTASKLEEIQRLVGVLDQKKKVILIEAKIVQIILSDEYKMGVDWEAIVSDFKSLPVSSDLGPSGPTVKDGKLSMGTLSPDDYVVLLEALDTVGTTNILSNPTVNAFNNEEIKILVGSSQPFLTTTTTTPSSGQPTIDKSLHLIDVGVKLLVTSQIDKDGLITVRIKPDLSSLNVDQKSEGELEFPVKSGVTIVVGGLIKDEKMETINKIPILGDIPFVGFVFRNEDQSVKKTELVIFLTATFMKDETSKNSKEKLITPENSDVEIIEEDPGEDYD